MFPPEIFDAILDHVHEFDNAALDAYDTSVAGTFPRKALSRCALVCRSWLPRARHLGFKEVLLPNDDATVGIAFCALLDHPLCTFRPHVRALKLPEPYRCPSELMKRQWVRIVFPRLATLPNVEYLHVKDMWLHQVSRTDWHDIVLPLFGPHLKTLSIFSSYFNEPSQIVQLVSRCTQLEVLKLASLSMTRDRYYCGEEYIDFYPQPSLKLREVSFHGEESYRVIQWLASTVTGRSLPRLSIMSFEDMTPSYGVLVARCLDVYGSSITSLTLGFSEDGTYTNTENVFCKHANPSSLTSLRTIRFGPLGVLSWAPDTAAACHIARTLSEIGSTEIMEISLGPISCFGAHDISLMAWDAIICVLNRPTFSRLEVLRLIFWEEQAGLCEEAEVWLRRVQEKLRPQVQVTCSLYSAVEI